MFTNTSHDLDPSQCLAKTNASFLVGDAASTLTGCNTLASLHLQPGPHNEVNETKSFTYVSHSIKEFFSHIEKVPESFTNATDWHMCVDPQVQWTVNTSKFFTVHNHSQVFKPAHGSGPDALAQEIINNVTNIYFGSSLMFLGDPISAGYGACYDTRFDWEQGNRMHNEGAWRDRYERDQTMVQGPSLGRHHEAQHGVNHDVGVYRRTRVCSQG